MEIRFNLNPDALQPLQLIAKGHNACADDPSQLIKLLVHALANVPLRTRGGSEKGRKLNLTTEAKQARQQNAEKARAARRKAKEQPE